MIDITINKSDTGLIDSFTISGHALFANRGDDIVCAGVTAVSFGSINAVISLTGITPSIKQGKDGGYLKCTIPENIPKETREKIQLLLEGMVVSLETIERDYGKYVAITYN
ncbi:ribosomal-processing cysteine protease Prp [Bacillus sp. B1-b2]|uniref:ribosomal-processing cysteine protease Prp n=1 Tax=Bacillus sp. B1-b2 TaxID=2653201 RepID=UPI0012625D7A|nr:ribosomal-processing cysteine protease Prp [Bacillus sp. B1-b2]KAB7667323.1 ribosomal-processing cysteine protease Prp [Bacillus sp. B1-b2]